MSAVGMRRMAIIRKESGRIKRQTYEGSSAARRKAVAELEAWSAAADGHREKAAQRLTDEKLIELVHNSR